MARNGMKVAMLAVLAVLGSACGGAAAPESRTQKLGAAGGTITLAATGARIEVPAGAVSSEVEFRVTEVEVHGARRAIHVEARGKLERAMRVHFARPDGVATTETLRVVRKDDKGGELELADDKGGAGEVEAGDDRGGHGEAEPGDDKGHDWTGGAAGMSMDDGTFALEVGDDKGGAGELEPGDDKGGAGEVEAGDDKGGAGELEPGDDKGGAGELEPGDDKGGAGEPEPGDDKGVDAPAPAPVDDSGKVG